MQSRENLVIFDEKYKQIWQFGILLWIFQILELNNHIVFQNPDFSKNYIKILNYGERSAI